MTFSIHEKNTKKCITVLKKKSAQLLYYNITTNKNVSANCHIRMILEVSCDTEEDREEWLIDRDRQRRAKLTI